ncbi:hypothetical protein [Haloplanus halobius]|uniref:hypothetical protein n=1 Tax=Haloplanus halobius TaxID=2934938 RepID=UPI0020108881|nr:hypothetical protein [Haloplanus sp. XH21]
MKYAHASFVLLIVLTVCVAPGIAQEDTEDEEEDNSGIIDAINELVEAIQEFTGDWDATLEDVLIAVLFHPFKTLAQQLLRQLTLVLTTIPAVHPNPAVEEIHQLTLPVAFLLSSLVFMAAGLLYMIGPILGISYGQIRMILPRTILALIFATISLPVLQLGVDFSNALVQAFAPSGLSMSSMQAAGVSAGIYLAYVINSALLLAVVVVFLIRNVYIMFVAAISPLLAIGWSLPRVRRYSDSFIAGWFAALLMGPLDVLVLKLSMSLLSTSLFQGTQALSNWILGVASFSLLLFVPYQLYGASQMAVGKARSFSSKLTKRVKKKRNTRGGLQLNQDERNRLQAYRRRKSQEKVTDGGWNDDED